MNISLNKIKRNISNIPGWCTSRKIVVIESDDWGSIRMPSKEAFQILSNKGLMSDKSHYNLYDSLESNEDLTRLYEVLSRYRDINGKYPVFTGICVIANPDFEKIKLSGFENYYYEPFTETLKKYPAHDEVFSLWKSGIENRLFVPQFHGREHLNIQRWLRDLKANNSDTRAAFDLGLWGILTPKITKTYQAAFDLDFSEDIHILHTVINEGLSIFEDLLGYKAEYFVPTNGYFNSDLESTLNKCGIRFINTDKIKDEPLGNGRYRRSYHYLGQKNQYRQTFLTRNCLFEPGELNNINWIDKCLYDIGIAFRWKKPATISTHRVNYIGFLDPLNRDRNLKKLSELLSEILNKWPDVEFMTSTELGNLIGSKK